MVEKAKEPQVSKTNSIVEDLRWIRRKKHITQKRMAELMGITRSDTITRIEKSQVSPTLKTLEKMADVLEVEIKIVPKQKSRE